MRFLQFYTISKKEAHFMIVHSFLSFKLWRTIFHIHELHTLSSFIPLQFYSNRLLYYILLHFSRPCHAFIFHYVRIFIHFIAIFICLPFFFTIFFYISIQFVSLSIRFILCFIYSCAYFSIFSCILISLFILFIFSIYIFIISTSNSSLLDLVNYSKKDPREFLEGIKMMKRWRCIKNHNSINGNYFKN